MFGFRPLPWEYAVRNLFRRRVRTLLTLAGLTTVIVLVLVVVGFIRGLERSLSASGDPRVALVFAMGMGENLEYSSIEMSKADEVPASFDGVRQRYGQKYVSPELFLGTAIDLADRSTPGFGLIRGVTRGALRTRGQVEIERGRWPRSDEVLVGRLAATKLGLAAEDLEVGRQLTFEGRTWTVSGVFSAGGSVFESELWCRLDDLQQALQRQDLSLVAITLDEEKSFAHLQLLLGKRTTDLELQALRESDYYASLLDDYRHVRGLAWLVVLLVAGAGVFAGLNTMYGAVVGRTTEIATLQTLGFLRRAIVLSLIQEGVLLAAAASLIAIALAMVIVNGVAIRFTMGAIELNIDNVAILIGCATGLMLGCLGSLPPAFRAVRLPVVEGLKTV
ncbi:MAG: ABC transporter permease [Planctomycetota bacterium]|nr:MAG: ABC transporter permease [Planctomycetota bacterium]REJ88302.1 MAG: ABC transporter permease [Planctomycetota bacterium]REK22949.1 MAG: ABC transporter permease [Planctomycetota bacterium]REK44752.1 MAG: ABC transporter permease [Planctomycetota bacterium]